MSTSTDLEAQSRQEEAEVAFLIQSRILSAMEAGRKALWDLAEALYEFDEAHGWLKLGYENRSQWLAQADITLSRTTYDRYVRTWRKLVVEKQIDASRIRLLDQSKVAIVTDVIASDTVTVDDALSDVESLGASDLREKYYGPKPEPVSNVGQDDNPATNANADSGQLDAEQGMGPATGDLVGEMAEQFEEPEPDGDPGLREDGADPGVIEGTARDIPVGTFGGYEFPGWVTRQSVDETLKEFQSALDSGASTPRVNRRCVQLSVELAQAWLASQNTH